MKLSPVEIITIIGALIAIAGHFFTVIHFFSKQSNDIKNLRKDMRKIYGENDRPVFTYSTDCKEKRDEICSMMKRHFKTFSQELANYANAHKESFEKFDSTNIEARTKMFKRIEDIEKEMAVMKVKCKEFEAKNA